MKPVVFVYHRSTYGIICFARSRDVLIVLLQEKSNSCCVAGRELLLLKSRNFVSWRGGRDVVFTYDATCPLPGRARCVCCDGEQLLLCYKESENSGCCFTRTELPVISTTLVSCNGNKHMCSVCLWITCLCSASRASLGC